MSTNIPKFESVFKKPIQELSKGNKLLYLWLRKNI